MMIGLAKCLRINNYKIKELEKVSIKVIS